MFRSGGYRFAQVAVHRDGKSFAEAYRETRLEFIRGKARDDAGLTYDHPYFWAPFVLYGK